MALEYVFTGRCELTDGAGGADTRDIPEGLRDNFGTSEKWGISGFSGVSDTNEAI
jgi:hypothetical protein